MKKSYLALAVAALAATSIASTASAATVYDKDGNSLAVYGRVQSVIYSDKTGNVSNEETTLMTSGRLGVDMRSQITNGVAAFAKAEWEAANGDAHGQDNFSARYLWVGLDFGQFGSFKAGRFEPAMKYAISQTDIFDDWGCTGLAGNDDKRDGTFQYMWSGNGLDIIASLSLAKDGTHIDGAFANGESADMSNTFSFAAGYTSPDVVFGPIAVRAGFEHGTFADGESAGPNGQSWQNAIGSNLRYDDYNQYAVGLSWGSLDLGPYVAGVYQSRDFSTSAVPTAPQGTETVDLTVSGYEFVVGYALPNGIALRTGYLTKEYEVGSDKVKAATVPVYANWQLNPQFNVWAEARFDAGTDNDLTDGKNFARATGEAYDENVFSAGMRYVF
ncbi:MULTISPECIES: porin [unclassified Anaerobiospirillum]|uniref:porin n=1 Tax=unclassified Anaerobiospirillum TaxID=2647410 RepID=UPI001FF1AB1D|nr:MULTISPECIES: porin [unclassified Anaerobiospirillum]MCK0535467.1 porin [Anaerobiospirillum sp. NML120511]MCK0540690.1 porin [Anaerobiospirillum sp. NML02-A-032]